MPTKVLVNVPVHDLDRPKAFFAGLACTSNVALDGVRQ